MQYGGKQRSIDQLSLHGGQRLPQSRHLVALGCRDGLSPNGQFARVVDTQSEHIATLPGK